MIILWFTKVTQPCCNVIGYAKLKIKILTCKHPYQATHS